MATRSSETLEPDICVIGAGSAGLTVAAAAAGFGASVALVERGEMGGDCLNSGCVPSKALIAAAKHAHALREARRFGVVAGEPDIDFARVHDHVRGVITAIAPNDSVERFAGLGVRVLREHGRFLDRSTLAAGDLLVKARRFVIATGSSALVPPIDGVKDVPFLTNESLFDLTERPDHLLIVGGGSIGLEMAQAFRRLGAAVTVIEAGRALSRDDPELAAFATARLRQEGVALFEGAKATRIDRGAESAITLFYVGENGPASVDGSHLLLAAGRRPSTDDLGLEAAGVATGERGIEVDGRLRTSNRRIYAIGDVAGGPQFTHWAAYQAGLVVRSILFRLPARVNPDFVTWATYTDPEIAHVGLTEAAARERQGTIRVLRWPMSENDRAQSERAAYGLVKVVTTARGAILGAGIAARNAGDLIAPFALAVSQRLTVRSLVDTVLPYPTVAEAGKRAALSFYTPQLQNRWLKRLVRTLRAFG